VEGGEVHGRGGLGLREVGIGGGLGQGGVGCHVGGVEEGFGE
jgi:hypothetical protein